MEKGFLRKLFLLLATGFVLVGCSTQAPEDSDVEEPDTEDVATDESDNTEDTGSEMEEITAEINILIDGEAVADLSKEITVPEGTYLLDVMHENYEVTEEGGFISAIEGIEQDLDAERYWLYYIEGEMASVGAADYELQEGDQIEWRLEDSE